MKNQSAINFVTGLKKVLNDTFASHKEFGKKSVKFIQLEREELLIQGNANNYNHLQMFFLTLASHAAKETVSYIDFEKDKHTIRIKSNLLYVKTQTVAVSTFPSFMQEKNGKSKKTSELSKVEAIQLPEIVKLATSYGLTSISDETGGYTFIKSEENISEDALETFYSCIINKISDMQQCDFSEQQIWVSFEGVKLYEEPPSKSLGF